MAVVIERTRAGRSPTGQRADSPEEGTGRAPARTLARSDEGTLPHCGDCFPGTLFRTDDPEEYVCDTCATVYYVPYHPIGECEPVCPWCERRIYDCSYWGPPCERRARMAWLRGEDATPVLDEEKAHDQYAQDRLEYRED